MKEAGENCGGKSWVKAAFKRASARQFEWGWAGARVRLPAMPSHRSLLAWKEARQVSLKVIEAAKQYWKPWAAALFDQVLRASSSVQLNIAEGSAYGPSKTYTNHLAIAYGSALETIEILELLIDSSTIPIDFGNELLSHAGRSRQLLTGLLKYHRPRTKAVD